MSKKEVEKRHHKTFEEIRQVDDRGNEYWSARELYPILEYSRWEKFLNVLAKAVKACQLSSIDPDDHFHHMVKMVPLGSGAKRPTDDLHLSRYACYLVVQNGDPNHFVLMDKMVSTGSGIRKDK